MKSTQQLCNMHTISPVSSAGKGTQENNPQENSSTFSTYSSEGGVSTPSSYNTMIINKLGCNYLLQTFTWMKTKQSHTCKTIFYFHIFFTRQSDASSMKFSKVWRGKLEIAFLITTFFFLVITLDRCEGLTNIFLTFSNSDCDGND